jgi:flavin-binding protein dodecin
MGRDRWAASRRTSAFTAEVPAREDRHTYGMEGTMTDSIYRVTEVIGTSNTSWEDAAKNAVETAAESLRDLRIGEIVKLDVTIEDGKVSHYRARVNISFKYEHHE